MCITDASIWEQTVMLWQPVSRPWHGELVDRRGSGTVRAVRVLDVVKILIILNSLVVVQVLATVDLHHD
jgi:hypothetical protein